MIEYYMTVGILLFMYWLGVVVGIGIGFYLVPRRSYRRVKRNRDNLKSLEEYKIAELNYEKNEDKLQ